MDYLEGNVLDIQRGQKKKKKRLLGLWNGQSELENETICVQYILGKVERLFSLESWCRRKKEM